MEYFQSSLKGKSGILTGGSSGFGHEIVKALKDQGANIAVFSIDEPSADNKKEIEEIKNGNVEYVVQDIMQKGASEQIVKKTVSLYEEVDFCIANAGFAIRFENPILSMDIEEVERSMRIQFDVFPIAFTSLALAAAKEMRKKYEKTPFDEKTGHRNNSGSIVVTLSEAMFCPLRDDLLAYSSAKGAAYSALRTLAAVLGQYNVRVNGIVPGFANTEGPKKFYSRYPRIREDIEAKNHLKPTFMHPGSVVPAVNYLLGDNYITGEVIALDGGYNIDMKSYFQN